MSCVLKNMWDFPDKIEKECFGDSEQHMKRLGSFIKHFVFKEA